MYRHVVIAGYLAVYFTLYVLLLHYGMCSQVTDKLCRITDGSYTANTVGRLTAHSAIHCSIYCKDECEGFQYYKNGTCFLYNGMENTTRITNANKAVGESTSFQKFCPNGWIKMLRSCYLLRDDQTNQTLAKEYCSSLDSHLVVITSQTEHDSVVEAFNASTPNRIWIGGEYNVDKGMWRWVNGESWSYENLCKNCQEYDDSYCMDIMQRNYKNNTYRFMNAMPCWYTGHAVCEFEFKS